MTRFRLADHFLDASPYNAHTTTSDALWAGVPVLTCRGETFAGRVATSLVNAARLSDMATNDLAEYQALATKLARNRATCPLFDTHRFARHIEAAYKMLWETWQRGETPKSFSVEPIGAHTSMQTGA